MDISEIEYWTESLKICADKIDDTVNSKQHLTDPPTQEELADMRTLMMLTERNIRRLETAVQDLKDTPKKRFWKK